MTEIFTNPGKDEKPLVNTALCASFSAALEAAMKDSGILLVSDAQRLTEDTVIPEGVALVILKGGSVYGPFTLTVKGPFQAGRYRVFGDALDVVLEQGSVPLAYPQWWGAGSLSPAVLGEGARQTLVLLSETCISVKATIPEAFTHKAE